MPNAAPRSAVLATVCTALAVVVLDNTVVNVALPSVAAEFAAGTAELQLVVDAYVVVFGALLVGAGVAADRFGRRRTALFGIAALTVGVGVAVVAGAPWMLVASRAVMGVGAAALLPAAMAVLVQTYPPEERPRALAVWAAVSAAALAIGPVLGGIVTDAWGWRGVFVINLPFLLVAAVGLLRLVPESRDPDAAPVDGAGIALVTAATSGLVVVGVLISALAPTGAVVGTAALAVGCAVRFVRRMRRHPHPMVDLALYRNRRFVGAGIAVTVLALGTGSALFALTQYLQLVLGLSPVATGWALIPLAVGSVVGAAAGGRLPGLIGYRWSIALGLGVTSGGFLLLASDAGGPGYPVVAVALALGGLGTGVAVPGASACALGAAPPERAGMASALHDMHQQVGVAIGVAALGAVLTATYRSGLPAGVPEAAAGSPTATIGWAGSTPGAAGAADGARAAFAAAQAVVTGIGGACALAGAAVALVALRSVDRPCRLRKP